MFLHFIYRRITFLYWVEYCLYNLVIHSAVYSIEVHTHIPVIISSIQWILSVISRKCYKKYYKAEESLPVTDRQGQQLCHRMLSFIKLIT